MRRVLSDFAGRWKLERDISPVARFLGYAEWRAEDGLMHYIERGNLEIAGQTPMVAERRYLWDEKLNIYFEDGRFSTKCPHWARWLRIGVTLTNMVRVMISQTGKNGPAHGGSGGRARTTYCTAATQKCEFRVLKTHFFMTCLAGTSWDGSGR